MTDVAARSRANARDAHTNDARERRRTVTAPVSGIPPVASTLRCTLSTSETSEPRISHASN
jgi:hypothetical protein